MSAVIWYCISTWEKAQDHRKNANTLNDQQNLTKQKEILLFLQVKDAERPVHLLFLAKAHLVRGSLAYESLDHSLHTEGETVGNEKTKIHKGKNVVRFSPFNELPYIDLVHICMKDKW